MMLLITLSYQIQLQDTVMNLLKKKVCTLPLKKTNNNTNKLKPLGYTCQCYLLPQPPPTLLAPQQQKHTLTLPPRIYIATGG